MNKGREEREILPSFFRFQRDFQKDLEQGALNRFSTTLTLKPQRMSEKPFLFLSKSQACQ